MLHQPKPCQQEFQPRVEVGEAPLPMADDAGTEAGAHRRAVGQHQLHLPLQHGARQRRLFARQRMARGHHRHGRDGHHEFRLAVFRHDRVRRIERDARRAVAQPLLGPAQRFRVDGHRQQRKARLQVLERVGQHMHREHAFHRQRQLRLQLSRDALGARLERLGTAQQVARIVEHHAAGIVELRHLAGAVEERHAEAHFERLDGLADRRLDPPEPARGGRETAGFRHRFECPELVERHGIEHVPSLHLMDSNNIWPISLMQPLPHLCLRTRGPDFQTREAMNQIVNQRVFEPAAWRRRPPQRRSARPPVP